MASKSSKAAGKRPNILFIVADDLGFADLGCTGRPDIDTPNIDALASSGIRFTQSYANSCLCTNTRVALLTGQYQYRYTVGVVEPLRHALHEEKGMGLPPGTVTLPALLKSTGYRTALVGKWHVGELPHYGPLKSGYDYFFGVMGGYVGYFTHHGEDGVYDLYEGEDPYYEDGYLTHILSRRATQYIRDNAGSGQPFMLSLHYNAPHWPWSAPSVEAAARERETNPSTHADGGNIAIFKEMVEEMDKGIGDVLTALKESGELDNTLIIFTSDNGGERFSHLWPFVGRKRDLLEGGLRIPQIMSWRGCIDAGTLTEQVCISMDLTATCLEAAGVTPPPNHKLEGLSLLPMVVDGAPTTQRQLFWRMKERNQEAARCGDWKYLKVGKREFLFDLKYDCRERTNFATKRPEKLAEIKALWRDWNETMLAIPDVTAPIYANLSDMLW